LKQQTEKQQQLLKSFFLPHKQKRYAQEIKTPNLFETRETFEREKREREREHTRARGDGPFLLKRKEEKKNDMI
jgi:hypothetical protein